MKASNANKVISVLLSVAMCPMMVPSAAFAADDDAASGASSPSEQTQPADQAEGVDAGASSSDTIAPQPEETGEATDEAAGEAAPAAVAQVGDTTYTTLKDAFDALNSSNRTLTLLDKSAWDAATPVYYKAGEASGYAAKLTDALTAAYKASAGDITIVCRPDSDLGAMTHGHVANNITIYGNGAYVSGGECDLEVDTFQYSRETGRQTNDAVTELAGKTIAINAYDIVNLGVWGQRNTNATVNVNLTNCDGRNLGAANVQRVYISGTSGMNNITLTDCDFITAATAVYSNADGAVAINNCSFTGSIVPVNFNHKASGTQTVTVSNSRFTNCGTTGDWAAFAAPARFVNSAAGALKVTIDGCSFAGTAGANGDILIGDGRTGQKSNEVTLTVTKTAANVQAQKPGYYGEGTTVADASLKGQVTTTVAEGLDDASIESIVTPAPAGVAEVNGNKSYSSLQEAINAAPRNATVKLLADTKENVTISTNNVTLDLNGHTLNGGTEKGKPALTVTARVTVKDSSEAKTGTIMREDTAENSGVSSHYVIDIQGKGWLTFESGNVKNDSGAGGTKGASLVRVGDDSIAKYPGLNIKGGTFTQDNFIVIKVDRGDLFLNDGTLNSAKSYAIENWFRATVKGGTVNGNVSTWTYNGSGSSLEISGGTVNGNVESVTYDGVEGKPAKVSITGGTVNGTLNTVDYSTHTTSNDPTKATIGVTGGTFSTDPSRYLIEGSAATQNSDGTYGVAKAYLAQVGENSYYTMDEAFKAQTASGEAITLLRDYTTGSTFNSGTKARVVDLNGHTWTCTGTDANSAAFEINNPNASLTVKNGKVVSSQLVGLIPSAMGGTIKYDNSILTFENVEASTTATSGIETNGNNTNDTVVLKDSTLNVPNGFGIYFPSSGTLTIDNSTINAKTMGAQVCSGNLNVNAGSAITVSGDPVEKLEGDGAIQDGAAISIVNRPGYKGFGQIAITGGTFTAKDDNAAIKAYTWDSATKQESDFDNSAKTVAVSGGTFSSAVSADLCAEGYAPVENDDDTYGVGTVVAEAAGKQYASLYDAVQAVKWGGTVKLLADAESPYTLVCKGKVTFELGEYTITNTNKSGIASVIKAINGAVVTVNATTGGIDAGSGATSNYAFYANSGTVIVNGGNYTVGLDKDGDGNSLAYADKAWGKGPGTIRVNGGTFEAAAAKNGHSYVLNASDGSGCTIEVKGGTFKNFDPSNNICEGEGTNFVAAGYAVTAVENGSDTLYTVSQAVAQVGTKAFASLQAAIDAAQDGETVTLLSDIEQNTQLAISKSITLDLNDKTIKNTQDIWGDNAVAILSITNGAKVTITGDGTIDAKENDCYTINVVKGDLTIENGTFYGNISVVQVQEGTLSVKGGTFDLHQKWEGSSKYLINCIDKAYASGSAKVAISGGTFVGFDPSAPPEGEGTSYLAPGYAPVTNANGTYGVKLAEGSYQLQDYRGGDQTSWTYPIQEGMAFAGWYKDAAFKTPCTESDVEGAAYAKFVNITDLLKYKGRSLRMDKGDPSETTYLRFGYTKAIPNGATYIENGWYYKRLSAPTGDDIRFAAYNNALNDDGTITSNLVFNNVKARLYTANFIEKAFVKYVTIDGTTVEAVEGAYHSSSVSEAADAIIAHPMASKAEKDYAASIKSAIQ